MRPLEKETDFAIIDAGDFSFSTCAVMPDADWTIDLLQVEGEVEVDYSCKKSAKYNHRTPKPVESMMWKNHF